MASKPKSKSVTQSDLRKLMAQTKNNSETKNSSSKIRKLKLSSRELFLLEQERKQKEEAKKAKATSAPTKRPLPEDFFERKPVKSILKNSGSSSSTSAAASVSSSSSRPPPVKKYRPSGVVAAVGPTRVAPPPQGSSSSAADSEPLKDESETGKELPEGFFDDPIQDAKVIVRAGIGRA